METQRKCPLVGGCIGAYRVRRHSTAFGSWEERGVWALGGKGVWELGGKGGGFDGLTGYHPVAKLGSCPSEYCVRPPFMLVCSLAAGDNNTGVIIIIIYSIYMYQRHCSLNGVQIANTVVLFRSRQSPMILQWTYHHNNLW